MAANTSHAGPLPVDKPRRGGGILEWCLKAQDSIRRTRPIAGKGLRASSTPNGIILTAPAPVVTPTAFIQSRPPYVISGVGYVDIYDGFIFWADDAYGFSPWTEGSTTTVTLSAGNNQLYVNLDWSDSSPVATYETQATGTPTPTESNYKVHLATYNVDLAAESARRTFIAWNGGNIYIPSAYASA